MVTYTWNPFRELESLRQEVERAFEDFGGDWAWPRSKARFLPGRSARTYPLVNVSDDKDALYVEALAPGVNPESLDITVHRNTLRIAGEKPPLATDIRPDAFHRTERGAGKFVRMVELPLEVDRDRITADYKNGIVLITLPKGEAAKPKQISVQIN